MDKRLSTAFAFAFPLLVAASANAQVQGRVAGFKPSTSGLHFVNSFPHVPDITAPTPFGPVTIGDAANGLCGGMVYTVRDYFEAGSPPPPNTLSPTSGVLFDYVVRRLFDSFDLPSGPARYLELMSPALPDHETDFSRIGLAPHGRAWVMIMEEWPNIKADLDAGHLSPLALVRVISGWAGDLGQNHQVLAYAYDLYGTDLIIYVYDPNHPENDKVTIRLNIADPYHTTPVTYSTGEPMNSFFRTDYVRATPPAFAPPAAKLVGDFSGDGKADIALTGGAGWNTIPVAFSDGTGAFAITNRSSPSFASWATQAQVSKLVGDFNGDGKADIALSGPAGWNTLPVAFSNGDGTFAVTNNGVGSFAAWASVPGARKLVGDFNGDGKADIALTGPAPWNTIPVAMSAGTAGFVISNAYTPNFASWASDPAAVIVTGDFNGDGKTDLALTGPSRWSTVPVAFSNGNGTFTVTNMPAGAFPSLAANVEATALVGDFNADGKADIALTGSGAWTTVPVAFSNGNGTFTVTNMSSPFATDSYPFRNKLVGDFSGSGRSDLAGTASGSGSTSVVLGTSLGNGGFASTSSSNSSFAAWSNMQGVRPLVGDFSGDGLTDIALLGAPGWASIPVAFSAGTTFNVTNNGVVDFASWAVEQPL